MEDERYAELMQEKNAAVERNRILKAQVDQIEKELAMERSVNEEIDNVFRQQLVCAALAGTLSRADWTPEEVAQEVNNYADRCLEEFRRRAKERR